MWIGGSSMSLIKEIQTGISGLDQSIPALKKFARVMFIALSILGTLVLLFGQVKTRAFWLFGIGLIFIILAFILPKWLKPLHTVWMMLAFFLGYFMSRILLSLLFYLVLTPIGFILKLFGKDILKTKLAPDADTYWIKRTRKDMKKEDYDRLF